MTASISDTIKKLSDSASAKIDLTTTTRQKIRLNCIYKESEAPSFFLVFPPKVLPDTIDTEKICPVSINAGSTTLALNAQIIAIKGDRTLELVGKSSVRPESLREFFRVDTKLYITAEFEPQALGGAIPSWSIEGRTLDLSGSGVLAIFPEEPLSKQRIELSIDLDDDNNPIQCIGHIVKVRKLRKRRYQVSFHFDSISPKDKDTIISYCLREQRNSLRNMIQTMD